MKSAFFKTLAVTALAVAAAVPAAAQFDVTFDIGSANGTAAAPPAAAGPGSVTVRLNAVKTTANSRRVGDLQIRVFYNTAQTTAAPVVTVPGIHTAYAAVISSGSTADPGAGLDGNAETNAYRTLLVSFNPTNAPLDFGAGAVGDQAPVVALTFATLAGYDPAVDSFSFGTTADPSFPSGYRNSTPTPGPVYATNAVTADTATYVSYSIAADADGDGRVNAANESDFPAGAQTNEYMWDTDSDGISDGRELAALADGGTGTDPNNEDSDADGIIDGVELRLRAAGQVDSAAALFNPAVANSVTGALNTPDADGLPNIVGVDPNFTLDNTDDAGGPGVDPASDAYEYATGYDPNNGASFPSVGDVNGSGTADTTDTIAMYNYASGAPGFELFSANMPTPGNGNVSLGSDAEPYIDFVDYLRVYNYDSALGTPGDLSVR